MLLPISAGRGSASGRPGANIAVMSRAGDAQPPSSSATASHLHKTFITLQPFDRPDLASQAHMFGRTFPSRLALFAGFPGPAGDGGEHEGKENADQHRQAEGMYG